MLHDPDEALVEAERVRAVFRQAAVPLWVNVANAVLTAVVLASVVDPVLLLVWTGSVCAVSAARWAVGRLFFRRRPEGARCRPWAVLGALGSLASGALWGIGAAALFPAPEAYQLFLAFVVGGMCAGATAVNSVHLPSVLAFVLPASLPLAVRLLAEGSAPRAVSALMVLVFAAALSLAGLRAHRAFGEHVRSRLALDRQRRELGEANRRLREEAAERQAAEATLQQAQKMEAIGHLTGGIAHDFNNLLAVVMAHLDLIRQASGGDASVLEHAASAERAAERGARLIDGLLAFARRKALRPERVDPNALLREFRPLLLRAAGEKVRFEMDLDPRLPVCHLDPAHFQSAVLNLVINARDAMPGGGHLLVATRAATPEAEKPAGVPDAGSGRFVSVSVQDSGLGMAEEVLAKAFEPFFTTKGSGGSGLGLSQVRDFARRSGGRVLLHSEPGAGTRATLILPAAGEDAGAPVAGAGAEGPRPAFAGAVAIVVEDDPDVLDAVAACLAGAGCRVRAAPSADEALEILRRGDELHLLLADVALGTGPSGVELARAARRLRPGLAVVLTTGHAAAALAAHGVVAGEFPLLRKPFRPGELLARVGEAIGAGAPAGQAPTRPAPRS